MILKNIKIFVSLALLCLLVSCKEGCLDPIATNYNPNAKKSNDELCQYDASKNPLNLEVYHLFNGNNFSLDSIYYDDFGTMIKFNRAKTYVSKNCFFNSSNSCFDDTLQYLLFDPSISNYFLGYMEKELNTISVEFQVGVDSVSNHTDPASYQSDEPLSYQTPSMHWQMGSNPMDWSYLFVVVEGFADLNSNGVFDAGEIFVFHLGGDDFRSNPKNINCDISEFTNESKIKINLNWSKIIEDIDIKNENFTHTMDNIPLATKIATNSNNFISEYQ